MLGYAIYVINVGVYYICCICEVIYIEIQLCRLLLSDSSLLILSLITSLVFNRGHFLPPVLAGQILL